MTIDFPARVNGKFLIERLHARGKIEIGIDARRVVFCRRHHVHTPGNTEPSLLSIKRSDALPALKMHDGYPFVGSLSIDLYRKVLTAECAESSLLHAARDFLDRSRAANSGKIFVEKLVRHRHRGFFLTELFPFDGRRLGLFVDDDGCAHRIRGAAVARVAGHLAVSLEIVLIDGHHHVNHLPRGDFGLLVVFLKSMLHVAVFAFHSERSRNELHRGDKLIGRYALERLNILELFFSEFGRGGARSGCLRYSGLRPRGSKCDDNAEHHSASGYTTNPTILSH